MELSKEYPKIKGFDQHGVIFTKVTGTQAIGTCPFCRRREKFYVNHDTRQWDCKRCGLNGGFNKFLELSAKAYQEKFRGKIVSDLAEDRGLLKKTFRKWKIGWDGVAYTNPADAGGRVTDVRKYKLKGKWISTSGSHVGLSGVDEKSSHVWLCEGEWDGMAVYEALNKVRKAESVFTVPGANSFPKNAIELFQGKTVSVVFDNDEAGIRGEQRISSLLAGMARKVEFLHWPEGLPEGFDLRDLYLQEEKNGLRTLRYVKEHMQSEPRKTAADRADNVPEVHLQGKGLAQTTVAKEYRKWLHLRDVEVLSVIFGSVLANRLDGDPLWLFLVAPPGGTKTELLMSLSDSPLIVTTTSLTPQSLISGASFATGGDPSLIPKLNEKVLIIKDFTPILSMQQGPRDEIFSILRDAYDGRIEKVFGNGIWRHYESKFGVIAGVTPIIETFSSMSSVLGERFLKYKIKQSGTLNKGRDMIQRALDNVAMETEMRADLRRVAYTTLDRPIANEDRPKLTKDMKNKITSLAQWTANLRGAVSREKYTGEVQFKPTTEVGTRLAKQFAKLCMGIAMFHKEDEITDATYQTTIQVAKDTIPDRVEEVIRQLYLHIDDGYTSTKEVSEWTRFPSTTMTRLLEDLALLRIVQKEPGQARPLWRLSNTMLRLMEPLDLYSKERSWKAVKRRTKNKKKKKKVTRRKGKRKGGR